MTPVRLPPPRITAANSSTESQNVKELGEIIVILAANSVPVMPAQKAPSTKAISL